MHPKALIFLKGENKTDTIDSYGVSGDYYFVTFKNNPQEYKYHLNNVKIMHLKNTITDTDNICIYKNNIPFENVKKILDYGELVKINFKDGTSDYESSKEITINNSVQSNNIIKYLKDIAEIRADGSDNAIIAYLFNQYKELNMVNDKSSLYTYSYKKNILKKARDIDIYYPFGFNLSQKKATEMVFENSISIIEGPPGTGKTQTILNIIANAILNKKTIAIVSNNNSATDNVVEKLEKGGYGFFVAALGNSENKKTFFSKNSNYPKDFDNWQLSRKQILKYKRKIYQNYKELKKILKHQNIVALLTNELKLIQIEKKTFDEQLKNKKFENLKDLSFFKLNYKKTISFLVDNQIQFSLKDQFSFADKFKLLAKHGIYKFDLLKSSNENIILLYQKKYYETKVRSLNEKILKSEGYLKRKKHEDVKDKCIKTSEIIFNAGLYNLFSEYKNKDQELDETNYKRQFNQFIKRYPVIMSTTQALRKSVKNNFLFDYVVVDEASQVDIVTGAIAMSCARNLVIVGDEKQLSHIVQQNHHKAINKKAENYEIEPAYDYIKNSILTSIKKVFDNRIKTVLLKEHYRCQPEIINFCNLKFYENNLIPLKMKKSDYPPIVYIKTAKGNHMRHINKGGKKGRYNQREIESLVEEVLKGNPTDSKTTGFIAPFKKQVEKANEIIGQMVETNTVHKFQGREKQKIVFSTVLDKSYKSSYCHNFVDDAHMINVAVSRAEEQFILVSGQEVFNRHGSNIGDLIRYIMYNAPEYIIESELISVFDLLYSEFSDKLLSVKKKIKNNFQYKSEELMNTIIKDVLSIKKYSSLKHIHSIRLKSVFKNLDLLNEREKKFINHPKTSIDFLIFNKFDKSPVLAVEVDGVAFHENKPKQLIRDELKDNILKKYNIEIIRFKTNGSNENKKLEEKLDELIS